jgi:GMP synthase (glutamine-hydrolysing)
MEGSSSTARARSKRIGQETPGEIYARALLAEMPDLHIDILNGADEGAGPPANDLCAYDGFVISGSALHAYDEIPEVTRQIEWVRKVADAGLPILGSCWGLQICAMAGGGMVARNVARAEMGIARKISPTAEGRSHPMLDERTPAFDAPCIHYDDVTHLPEGSIILASNSHCPVQAAVIPLGRSLAWGVQYHPEFDLPHIASIYEGYGDELIRSPFFDSRETLDAHIAELHAVAELTEHSPLAWRLGIDRDLLHGPTRRTEVRNWLHQTANAPSR